MFGLKRQPPEALNSSFFLLLLLLLLNRLPTDITVGQGLEKQHFS
jgi:hypothetical protein